MIEKVKKEATQVVSTSQSADSKIDEMEKLLKISNRQIKQIGIREKI